jgi:hypothetical protein
MIQYLPKRTERKAQMEEEQSNKTQRTLTPKEQGQQYSSNNPEKLVCATMKHSVKN